MDKGRLVIAVEARDWARSYDFGVYWTDGEHTDIATGCKDGNLILQTLEPTDSIKPLFSIRGTSTMQGLMDSLWANGLRPTQMKSSNELIEAKDTHIADLRKLLFKKEGINK